MAKTKQQPAHEIRLGAIKATIWENQTTTGTRHNVTVSRIYKDGDEWKPVENVDAWGVEKDRYNKVAFKPVSASGLRLEVTMQPGWSAGVAEWKVE